MFRISDFSRLTRVTVKTLRHYDRVGLLEPAFVDPATSYRHYSARQAVQLQRILALREQGFSLGHIRDLIGPSAGVRTLAAILHARRAELEYQLELDRRRLESVTARLDEIERGEIEGLPEVVVSALPPVRVASHCARVASLDQGIEELFESLEREVGSAGVRGSGPPLVIYHDRDHRVTDARVEVAVPVVPDARAAGRARIRVLPAFPTAACLVYSGSYDQWTRLSRGLVSWLAKRRLRPSGPMREAFLQFEAREEGYRMPHSYRAENRGDLVTEMQIPVRGFGPAGASRARQGSRRDAE